MKIIFEIDGRRIDTSKFTVNGGGEMRKMLLLKQDVERKLQGLVDPQTGQAPEIVIKGKSIADMVITTPNGDKMAAEIRRRLNVT